MATKIFIGVDPGASGGFAWFDMQGEICAKKFDGMTESDIARAFQEICAGVEHCVFLEKAGPSRSQDPIRRVQGVSSTFKFGVSYGFLRGVLIASQIVFEDAHPNSWTAAMSVRGLKGETATEKKNRHKAAAQRLFPCTEFTLTHAVSDAVLIAEFCRRTVRQREGAELAAGEAGHA